MDARDILTSPPPPPDVTLRYGSGHLQVADLWLPRTARGGSTASSAGAARDNAAKDPARPGDVAGAPLILFFHGGFWRAEWDRTHTAHLAAALAAVGYAVCTPEYRRTGQPGGGWPGTFDDVAAAVDRLPGLAAAVDALPDEAIAAAEPAGVAPRAAVGPSDAESSTVAGLGGVDRGAPHPGGPGVSRLDPGRVVLAGHSAGGHLALWAAARHRLPAASGWRQPFVEHEGVVALAPVSDLAASHEARLDDDAAGDLIGGPPARYPERWAQADPARLLPLDVPVHLIHGAQDEWVPCGMSREFAARARAAGDEVALDELAGCGHFELIDPRSAAWQAVLAAFRAVAPVPGQ